MTYPGKHISEFLYFIRKNRTGSGNLAGVDGVRNDLQHADPIGRHFIQERHAEKTLHGNVHEPRDLAGGRRMMPHQIAMGGAPSGVCERVLCQFWENVCAKPREGYDTVLGWDLRSAEKVVANGGPRFIEERIRNWAKLKRSDQYIEKGEIVLTRCKTMFRKESWIGLKTCTGNSCLETNVKGRESVFIG